MNPDMDFSSNERTADAEQRAFQDLLRLAQEGSQEAARELYEKYGKYVVRCVRNRMWHRLRSKFDSQDFVQQVWASFFRDRGSLPNFQTPDDLIAWLQTLAENKVVTEGRRRRMEKCAVMRETPVDETSDHVGQHPATRMPTPSAMAVFNEEYDSLIGQQQPETREIAQLRYEGNTYHEIAEELGINEATARKAMRRLKRRMPAGSGDSPAAGTKGD
jgi:RNA polymerase sigma factor (sigma-70 family)